MITFATDRVIRLEMKLKENNPLKPLSSIAIVDRQKKGRFGICLKSKQNLSQVTFKQ